MILFLRVLGWIIVFAIIAVVGFSLYVRTADTDPDRWHVDPLTAPSTGNPNSWRLVPEGMDAPEPDAVAPVYAVEPATLSDRFASWISDRNGTRLVAQSDDGLWMTWEERSRLMGYPDYISVRFMAADEGGSTMAVFSRSRYGKSDLGVNAARGDALLEALKDIERPG